MLPQYFEPFNLQDNQQLRIAYKKGKLPYLEDKGNLKMYFSIENFIKHRFLEIDNDLTTCWLDSIVLGTMRLCIEQTLQIQNLTIIGYEQLKMDLRKLNSLFSKRDLYIGFCFRIS